MATKSVRTGLLFVLSVLVASCVVRYEYPPGFIPQPVVTSENWTFIAFDEVLGTIDKHVELIGSAIAQWESEHPERRIVDIDILYDGRSYLYEAQIYGISIYSEER